VNNTEAERPKIRSSSSGSSVRSALTSERPAGPVNGLAVQIYNFKINQSRFHVALHSVHFVYSMLTHVGSGRLLLLLFNSVVAICIPFLFQLLGSVG
jgi:hypothetical protein